MTATNQSVPEVEWQGISKNCSLIVTLCFIAEIEYLLALRF